MEKRRKGCVVEDVEDVLNESIYFKRYTRTDIINNYNIFIK